MLVHKVEQQKKARQPFKPQNSIPSPHEQTVNKGSSFSSPKPTARIPPIPPKKKTKHHSKAYPHNQALNPFLRASKDVLSAKDLGT